jgi:hypothetical protein
MLTNIKKKFQLSRIAYLRGDLRPAITRRVVPYWYGLKNLLRHSSSIQIHNPDYRSPDPNDAELVRRIMDAYRKAKLVEAPSVYAPASIWQEQLAIAYSSIIEGVRDNDMEKCHYFLENFGCWKLYNGVENTTMVRKYDKNPLTRAYLKYFTFENRLKRWNIFNNKLKPVSRLSYPTYGNQSGALIDGTFVGIGSFFCEIYGSLLSNLLTDKSRPVVAEIGGGYGKFSYFILRDHPEFTYIDFDLPEVICLAAYYFLKCHPDKKVLLYGEAPYDQFSHSKYDAIFMPMFEIEKLAPSSVDLFVNKNSLGEMSRDTVDQYFKYACPASRYIFHLNHELYPNIYDDGSKGYLGFEYPIPQEEFKLLFRCPDLDHMEEKVRIEKIDIFAYLYERKDKSNI